MNVATVGPEACLVHSETGQSVVPGRGKVAHQPSHRQVVGSRRCKAEQAKGRHPYLVTRALVLWRSLRAHRLRDKGVGGRITSAGTSSPGAMPKKSTPATTPVAQSVSRLPGTGGRPPYCRRVPFRALALMRYQRGGVAHHYHLIARWWLAADVLGPKSGVHGLICLDVEASVDREGTEVRRSCATVPSVFHLV